ncbi:spermine synthase-like protein, partial [Euroglyphus maynei]
DNDSIHLYCSNELSVTVRYYEFDNGNKKVISLNGEISENCVRLFRMNNVENKLKDRLNKLITSSNGEQMDQVETVPTLKRDKAVPSFFLTSDGRVLEYDFDKVLVNETTPFQNIKILHSPSLGNCLLLDDMQNLAEADLPYTHGLMNYGHNNYKGN